MQHRFELGPDNTLDSLAQAMLTTGFQATNVGLAIDQINKMVRRMQ